MTKTDWDALLPRLLLFAEGSRRACKQEKDADEALIHQNRALVLDDAAEELLTRVTLAERVAEAARWNLPLAKGYAAANPVGSNATYVAELEERLAAYDEADHANADKESAL